MCATISRTYGPNTASPVAAGQTILAAHVNTDLDTVYAAVNGNLEDANIKSGANIAISKTALGTYVGKTAYTPTWRATGTGTVTNSTISTTECFYTQIGKNIYWHARVSMNAGFTGGTGEWRISLPQPCDSNITSGGTWWAFYNGSLIYSGTLYYASTTEVAMVVSGFGGALSSTIPGAGWINGDHIRIAGYYLTT